METARSSVARSFSGQIEPSAALIGAPGPRPEASYDDLLLRETLHRCGNDLQLVVGLLSLQARRVRSEEARAALADATSRVTVLARARTELNERRQPNLGTALRHVCEALHSQPEPRSILISMTVEDEIEGLPPHMISTLALVVNELATSAIKHAFAEGKSGAIKIEVGRGGGGDAVVVVDDDGLPFRDSADRNGDGLGIGLVVRLLASIGATILMPAGKRKRFEIRVPAQPA